MTEKIKKKRKRKSIERLTPLLSVKIHKLACDGLSNNEIADSIGISRAGFVKRIGIMADLAELLDDARTSRTLKKISTGKAEMPTLQDYVYGHLSAENRHIYDKLVALENSENSMDRIRSYLFSHSEKVQQRIFLQAMVESHFNASRAMARIGLPKSMLDKWIETDPNFIKLIDEITYHKKAFIESRLMDLIRQGDSAAIMFANKTLNSDLGYGNKLQVTSSVEHKVSLDLSALDIPLEDKRKLLEAIKKQREYATEQVALPAHEDVIDAEYTTSKGK